MKKDAYGGRGLFATRALNQGDLVATFPRALVWGQREARRLITSLPVDVPDMSALVLLILQLQRSDDGRGHPFSRTLPRSYQVRHVHSYGPQPWLPPQAIVRRHVVLIVQVVGYGW